MPSPIIYQDPFVTALGGAISSIGQQFGQAEQIRGQRTRQKEYGTILEETLGGLSPESSALEVTQALSQAIKKGVPPELAKDYGSLYSVLQKAQPNAPISEDQINKMSTLFKKFGMAEDVAQRNAELWAQLTTGGQTEMAKMLVDQISRNQFGSKGSSGQDPSSGMGANISQQMQQKPIGMEQMESISESPLGVRFKDKIEFQYPKVNVFEDRTPKERISLKTDLLKKNTEKVSESSEKIRKKNSEFQRYAQLERLNESGKLPEGLENLNINWLTGDILFPKLANAETQAYVKAINDFTTQAKDTFGARVTNFELGAFMKRLPTLANSSAGRSLIINQMKLANEADQLYDKALLDVYDHYGIQNIDFSKADKIARKKIESELSSIKKRSLENLDSVEIQEARSLAPQGKLPARSPEGKIVYIWAHQSDKAEKKGYKIL
jgi:hypothetical protein